MSTKTAFMTPVTKKNKELIEETEKELEELESTSTEEEEEKEEVEPKAVTSEDETWKKRYGDLRSHSNKTKTELQKQIDELKSQLTSTTKSIKPPASDEDLDAWKKKYPDVANIVETLAMKIADQKVQEAQTEIESLRNNQKQSAKEKALEVIVKTHPDFFDIQTDDSFHGWVDDQSKWVQDALYENDEDSKAVISVINLYKAEKGIFDKTVRKEAAKGVKTKDRPSVDSADVSGTFTESQVNKMSSKEYAKHEDAIMKSMRDGKFVYDMSGAA